MNSLLAVFTHEWRRSLTTGRVVWWVLMCLFPILIAMLIRFQAEVNIEPNPSPSQSAGEQRTLVPGPEDGSSIVETQQAVDEAANEKQRRVIRDSLWTVFLYVMIPCLSSALGVLLTAGPAVATELEQRSWVYMATRPHGIIWLLLGKFLVAFTWGYSAALIALTGATAFISVTSKFAVWWPMAVLSGLSCLAYSGVFLFVGAIFPKRAMVFSVMYAAIVEVVLGIIPAVVNRLTVQYRLRSLLLRWLEFDESIRNEGAFESIIGSDPAWMHIFWLLALTVVYVVAAQIIVHKKEFTAASEGDL